MRISFDIDGLLVGPDFKTEAKRWKILGGFSESLRLGTRTLFQELTRQGHEVCIYTTSLRSEFRIRRWLWIHGLTVGQVINGARHANEAPRSLHTRTPSKYPPAFNIDFHVDDSPGVLLEGKDHGFAVLVIEPTDSAWVQHVLDAVQLRN